MLTLIFSFFALEIGNARFFVYIYRFLIQSGADIDKIRRHKINSQYLRSMFGRNSRLSGETKEANEKPEVSRSCRRANRRSESRNGSIPIPVVAFTGIGRGALGSQVVKKYGGALLDKLGQTNNQPPKPRRNQKEYG